MRRFAGGARRSTAVCFSRLFWRLGARMRIAICTNFVSPYRRPVFEALAERTGARVRVFTSTRVEGDRDWAPIEVGGSFDVMRSRSIRRTRVIKTDRDGGFPLRLEQHIPIGLPVDLKRFRPDVVISGEMGARTALACVTASALGAAFVPWTYHAEAQLETAQRGGMARRAIFGRAGAVIGMGRQARAVLRRIGCAEGQIFDAPNAADTTAIDARMATAAHEEGVRAIRRRFRGQRVALVVGRLIPMKGIEALLEAWSRLDERARADWDLVFVGSGPLRGAVERAGPMGVHAVGSVPAGELADWYRAADLHVFASMGDPWGLVVNEAMRCGTPTLCSKRAGCADDLVRDRLNGLLFDPAGPAELVARSLDAALRHPGLSTLGMLAARDIAWLTPDAMAAGMEAAVRHALDGHRVQHVRRAS